MAKKVKKPGFFKEFKEFINRGNAFMLAVGVVIGGAFSAIVTAFVNILLSVATWPVPGGLKGLVSVLPALTDAQKGMDAVVSMKEEQWENVSADKLMAQVTGLARAIAYKKGVDIKTKSDEEIALEAKQGLLYDVLKKENPKLYAELQQEIARLRQKVKDGGGNE